MWYGELSFKIYNDVDRAFYESIDPDDLVKSHLARRDGLWKKLDILGAVSYAAIRQYIWYGGSSCKTCNDVD